MNLLSIMQPLPAAVVPGLSAAGPLLPNVLTPNPREAFAATTGDATITLDLGLPMLVDTFFLGFTNLGAGDGFSVYSGQDFATRLFAGTFALSYRRAPLRHAWAVLAVPVTTRYIRLRATSAVNLVAGIAAAGLSIRPSSGHEWGGGRPISDTGKADRLLGGSFGILPGVAAGGFQWTMPALTDEEAERLYALSLDAGGTTSILVLEEDAATNALNESAHWGLLTKLEPYERQQPGETKWSMQVQDWA